MTRPRSLNVKRRRNAPSALTVAKVIEHSQPVAAAASGGGTSYDVAAGGEADSVTGASTVDLKALVRDLYSSSGLRPSFRSRRHPAARIVQVVVALGDELVLPDRYEDPDGTMLVRWNVVRVADLDRTRLLGSATTAVLAPLVLREPRRASVLLLHTAIAHALAVRPSGRSATGAYPARRSAARVSSRGRAPIRTPSPMMCSPRGASRRSAATSRSNAASSPRR